MKKMLLLAGAMAAFLVEAAAPTPAPSDAQILAIMIDASQVDIDAGKLAQFKSKDPEVLYFAHRMVADHGVAVDSAAALMAALKLKPQGNPTSQRLKEEGEKNTERLRPLRGAAFDRAYIEHELAYHGQVLDIIDNLLLPNAQDEGVKHLLAKARPAFFSHVLHARRLQESVYQRNP